MFKALHYNSEVPRVDSQCRRGIFPWHLIFSCVLVSTQSLTVGIRITLGVKVGRCVRLTTYHSHVPIVKKSEGLNLLEPRGPVQACNGTATPLPLPEGRYTI